VERVDNGGSVGVGYLVVEQLAQSDRVECSDAVQEVAEGQVVSLGNRKVGRHVL
jgi:hypothetical protein